MVNKRYVDDVLMIFVGVRTATFLEFLNSWDPDLSVYHDAKESEFSTSFLDLRLTIHAHTTRVSYRTYRKPMNIYIYIYIYTNTCHLTRAILLLRRLAFFGVNA